MEKKEIISVPEEIDDTSDSNERLGRILEGGKYKKYGRFVFAALGSIPWVGGLIAASSALHAEIEQGKMNKLLGRWLEEHRQKINELGTTLENIVNRLDQLGEEVDLRLQDENYLSLVRQGFRTWDEASTDSKKSYVRRCLTNAGSTKICSDDVIRMFLDWIQKYDEAHFKVIKALYRNRGATRAYIWDQIHGEEVREDSADADLFKLLISDLSTGHVLRQIREKSVHGQFLAKRRNAKSGKRTVLESAFENTKPYELTELGSQFVHYVMEETIPRIGE